MQIYETCETGSNILWKGRQWRLFQYPEGDRLSGVEAWSQWPPPGYEQHEEEEDAA
jgi:hypothetical protein